MPASQSTWEIGRHKDRELKTGLHTELQAGLEYIVAVCLRKEEED